MNAAEWVAYVAAGIVLYVYCRRRFGAMRTALGLSALFLLPMYLALESTSQFITADENFYIHRFSSAARCDTVAADMAGGAFQTTLAVMSPVLRLTNGSGTWPDATAVSIFKLGHWLLGFLAFLWLLHRLIGFVDPKHAAPMFGLGAALLIFPQTEIALKTFNYDALSMLLGLVATLYLITALRDRDRGAARWAVIAAALAAQEKLIASPILLAAVSVFAAVRASEPIGFRKILIDVGRAVGIFLAVTLPTAVVLKLVLQPTSVGWNQLPAYALQPLIAWGWGILRFSFGITQFSHYALPLTLLSVLMCAVGAAILAIAMRPHAAAVRTWATRLVVPVAGMAVFASLLAGVLANYFVQPYWHPYHPVTAGHFQPLGEMNGVILHFDAETFAEHLVQSIGYCYAVFVNAVPTVLWVLAALILLTRTGRAGLREQPLIAALLIANLLAPCAYGVMQVLIGHRYLNLFLGAVAIALLLSAAPRIFALRPRLQWSAIALVVLAVAAETAPFRPFAATFRPLWAEYADADRPQAGHMNPSWVGWGEEMMLAGRAIQAAGVREPITLYCCYFSGGWVTSDPQVKQVLARTTSDNQPAQYGDHDYFVLNRSMVVQGLPLPPIKPDHVIAARGFEWAWVYQGRRLAEAGYYYDPKTYHFAQRSMSPAAVTAAAPSTPVKR